MAETPGKGRLSIIVHSGSFARVHYALAMASAAASVNRPATLFFTMGAVRALAAEGESGIPGWALMRADNGPANVAGDAGARDIALLEAGVAGFEELLAACVELGVDFIVCEMGLRAEGLAREALRADVPVRVAGLVTFMSEADPAGHMVVV